MLRYLARRLAFSVLLVAVVSSAAMLLTIAAPGDITSEQVGSGATARSIEAERARLGLDRSPLEQYGAWLARAARLDFGTSLLYGRPVAGLVAERAGNTLLLAVAALALALLAGVPLGVVSGSRRGIVPGAIRAASLAAVSMPTLVSSLLLVLVAARTGWLPTGGMTSADAAAARGWLEAAADIARHMILPTLAIALPLAATIERLQSQAMAETMGERFVAAAAARGVPPRRVLWRHVLKPSLRPVAAIFGLVFGNLLSGSFVVEIVTSWPGLGRLMYRRAAIARPVPGGRMRGGRRRVPGAGRAGVGRGPGRHRPAAARAAGGARVRRAGIALVACIALARRDRAGDQREPARLSASPTARSPRRCRSASWTATGAGGRRSSIPSASPTGWSGATRRTAPARSRWRGSSRGVVAQVSDGTRRAVAAAGRRRLGARRVRAPRVRRPAVAGRGARRDARRAAHRHAGRRRGRGGGRHG